MSLTVMSIGTAVRLWRKRQQELISHLSPAEQAEYQELEIAIRKAWNLTPKQDAPKEEMKRRPVLDKGELKQRLIQFLSSRSSAVFRCIRDELDVADSTLRGLLLDEQTFERVSHGEYRLRSGATMRPALELWESEGGRPAREEEDRGAATA